MRTVNVPLLIALLIGVTVVGGGTYFLHKYQVKRNAVVFLDQAEEARERFKTEAPRLSDEDRERRIGEVSRQYEAYLRLRPTDVDSLVKLGDFLSENRKLGAAVGTYEQVLWQDAGRNDVRRKLVDIAMNLAAQYQFHPDPGERARQSARWYDAARAHLEQLVKDRPSDPELLDLSGRCLESLGKDDDAEARWERAIAADPQYVDAYARLAGLLREDTRRAKEADALMHKLAEDNPDLHAAQQTTANYALRNNQIDAAIARVKRALELKEDDRATLLLAAHCASAKAMQLAGQRKPDEARAQLDEAREYTARLRKLFSDDPNVYRTAAEIEVGAGDLPKAVDVLRDGLKQTKDHPDLVFAAVNMLLDSGARDEAKQIYDRIDAKVFREGIRLFLEARLKFAAGQWVAAIELFDKSRSALAGDAERLKFVDYYTGRAYAQLNNPDKAIKAYRAALSRDPFFVGAQTALIDMLQATNQLNEAADLFAQIGPRLSSASWIPMARLLVLRNLRLPPTERDWTRVERLLDEAAKALPNATGVPLLRAEMLMAQGNNAEAEKVVVAARDAMPDRPELWATLIAMADKQSDWAKAEQYLREAEEKAGDTVDLRLAKARYLVHRLGKEAGPQLQKLTLNLDKFSAADQQALLQGLSSVSVQADNVAGARELLERVAAQQKNNVQIRFSLFEVALHGREMEAARRAVDEIGKIEGQGALWHYGQAALLSQEADKRDDPRLDKAVEHVRAAIEARPSWSRAYLLLGALYDQQGKTNLAFDYYRQAIERGERNWIAIQKVARWYQQKRDYANAEKTLELLKGTPAEDLPSTEQIRRDNLVFSGKAENLDEAVKLARQAAERSKNPRDHLMLGQVLEMASQQAVANKKDDEAKRLREQAEAALREASTLAPENPEVWVTLVRFYALTKEFDKADKAVAQAAAKVAPAEAPLAVGQCYEVLGKAEEAQKKYQEALAAAPKDFNVLRTLAEFSLRTNQWPKARELAQQVLAGDVPAATEEQIWARRVLADVFINEGGAANLEEALKLIEQNLKARPDSETDKRARAGILAARPSRPETDEAIRQLRDLVPASKQPNDQFLLARLYARKGDWAACSNQMRTLLASHPDEVQYLVFYIDQLLRHNESINAVEYLERLERKAPQQFITAKLRAEYLVARKNYQQALQLLKGFIDREGAIPADRPIRLRLVAETLEQLSHAIREPGQKAMAQTFAGDAEMVYRNYVAARPEHEILLVGFLVRLGNIDEALNVLERTWEKNKADGIAPQALEFARSGFVKQPHLVRLEAVMQQAIKKFDKPTSLMLVLAEVFQKENRIADAEKLYRGVIANDPKNVTALNNLAVLLALENRNLDEALQLVNAAIKYAGREPEILDSRASVHIAMKQYNEALRDLDEAINDSPQPIRLFHQAQAYYKTGKRRQATEALKTALDKGLTPEMLQVPERKAFEELKKVVDLDAAAT